MNLILSRLIKKAYRTDSVITVHIYGNFGAGKTSYALWVAYNVLGDWDKVLEYLFFSPEEASEKMREAIMTGRRLPIIIMDDAGLWLDKLTWYEKNKIRFMEFFNLIRSVTAGIIFTTPSEDLPRSILQKTMFRVSVVPIQAVPSIDHEVAKRALTPILEQYNIKASPINVAKVYKTTMLPTFRKLVKTMYYDIYPLFYPIYNEYNRLRKEALKHYFEKWRTGLVEEVAAPKPSRYDRYRLYQMAEQLLINQGVPKFKVAEFLMENGIPKTTAYRWLNKILEEHRGRDPSLSL